MYVEQRRARSTTMLVGRELWQMLICWKRKASDDERQKSLGGEHARHPQARRVLP
jgi:hypothetical protein